MSYWILCLYDINYNAYGYIYICIKNIEVTNLKITNSPNKLSNSQENKKKVVFAKGTIKINKNKVEDIKTKPKSRYTAYMLWSKEMRQKLLKENPGMGNYYSDIQQ